MKEIVEWMSYNNNEVSNVARLVLRTWVTVQWLIKL